MHPYQSPLDPQPKNNIKNTNNCYNNNDNNKDDNIDINNIHIALISQYTDTNVTPRTSKAQQAHLNLKTVMKFTMIVLVLAITISSNGDESQKKRWTQVSILMNRNLKRWKQTHKN